MNTFAHDCRYAIRTLLKARGFAFIAVLTLALGIGSSTALFSVVNGVLLNPLPYPRADELVTIYEEQPGVSKSPMSYLNFLDWQRMSRTFSSMAIYRNQDYSLRGAGVRNASPLPDLRRFLRASAKSQSLVATSPGMTIGGKPPVAILSGGFWQQRFAGSLSVLNSIILNGAPYG